MLFSLDELEVNVLEMVKLSMNYFSVYENFFMVDIRVLYLKILLKELSIMQEIS